MRKSRVALAAAVVALFLAGGSVQAQDIFAGNDCWVTEFPGTQVHLTLPADYFYVGSDPFDQIVNMLGKPLPEAFVLANCPDAVEVELQWVDPHGTPVDPDDRHAVRQQSHVVGVDPIDTIVKRNADITFTGVGVAKNVSIEIIALSLQCKAPIVVTGSLGPKSFDCMLTLDGAQGTGNMDLTPNMVGDMDSGSLLLNSLPINYQVMFDEVGGAISETENGLNIDFTGTQGTFATVNADIPTLSTWGMIALVGILMIAATAMILRRQRSAGALS